MGMRSVAEEIASGGSVSFSPGGITPVAVYEGNGTNNALPAGRVPAGLGELIGANIESMTISLANSPQKEAQAPKFTDAFNEARNAVVMASMESPTSSDDPGKPKPPTRPVRSR